jgi:hypothetical protein
VPHESQRGQHRGREKKDSDDDGGERLAAGDAPDQ